jgi:hypothetical protein
MPLLGGDEWAAQAAPPLREGEEVFVVKFTNEVFRSYTYPPPSPRANISTEAPIAK